MSSQKLGRKILFTIFNRFCYEITKAHLEISITNLESTKDAETIYPDELKQQQLKNAILELERRKKLPVWHNLMIYFSQH